MNRLTWAEIMRRYPCQWMLLAETEDDDGGNIESAHVLDYDRSAITLLDRTGLVPGATLIHTAGRPLCVTPAFRPRPRPEQPRRSGEYDPHREIATTKSRPI